MHFNAHTHIHLLNPIIRSSNVLHRRQHNNLCDCLRVCFSSNNKLFADIRDQSACTRKKKIFKYNRHVTNRCVSVAIAAINITTTTPKATNAQTHALFDASCIDIVAQRSDEKDLSISKPLQYSLSLWLVMQHKWLIRTYQMLNK